MSSDDLAFNRGDQIRLKEEWWPGIAGARAHVVSCHWEPDGSSHYVIRWDNPSKNLMESDTTKVYKQDEGKFERVS
ncbi:hypothetical protein W02_10740 [Nitrospira sp. KM1]|uniref:hypothetical protein n=1 Tax=Nitrospira sp. KM1 TaxID=1936990 RepID=UPI0013A751CE|nr:hypothetical protein [Nitrospira sp. KM1]BCA53934.1 hypothetical protein W02_10740 [Nitrospira sp. KM1]